MICQLLILYVNIFSVETYFYINIMIPVTGKNILESPIIAIIPCVFKNQDSQYERGEIGNIEDRKCHI